MPSARCWPLASSHWPLRIVSGQWLEASSQGPGLYFRHDARRSPLRMTLLKTFVLAIALLCSATLVHAQSDSASKATLEEALRVAQETADLLDPRAAATRSLKDLQAAQRDGQRDSISANIKKHLRAVLEADDGLTADLKDLPISRVDAPDGKFRLLTWNVPYSNGTHAYEGFLLVHEKKRPVLFELRDMTEKIENAPFKMLGPDFWYGTLYYTVVPVKRGGKTWYTLLGWKGHSNVESRKVIEVLSFKGGVPQFGAPLFGEGRAKRTREIFGFSFQASMSLKWEQSFNRIVLDHLSPMKPEFAGQAAFMGPDLSYDAYVWEKDHWLYQRDVDVRQEDQSKPWNKPPRE